MDRFDVELVRFVLSWAPYGGPPSEECLPSFGMTSERLSTYFRLVVWTGRRDHLDADEHDLFRRASTLLVPPTALRGR